MRESDELRELVVSNSCSATDGGAGKSNPVAHPVLEKLQGIPQRYGHQVYTLDFVAPTQAEDPTRPAQPEGPGRQPANEDARDARLEMAEERERLVERVARSLDPVRRRMFLKIVRWAQSAAPHREEAFFYVGYAWPVLRRLAMELGAAACRGGSLDHA